MTALEKMQFWREFISKRVTHRAVTPETYRDGKWIDKTEDREVRLLAVVQGWAMVRRPKCMPYVCHIDELRAR